MMRRIDIQIVVGLLLLALGFFLGQLGGGGGDATTGDEHGSGSVPSASTPNSNSTSTSTSTNTSTSTSPPTTTSPQAWTCSMHPQFQLPESGKCPICFMDLIPLETGGGENVGPTQLTMSEEAMKLAEIVTVPVVREYPTMELRLVGKIEFDETRQKQITAWVGGRLDRLYVDYTGVRIRNGDHLVSMYSPVLVSAQEELLQSLRAKEQLATSSATLLKDTSHRTVEAARDKLRLLGLTATQIERLEQRGEVEDHITIYAPTDGIVVAKHAVEGTYVEKGEPIYGIADLSRVWVKLDAYESDLVWLRYGQAVTFTTVAFPGRGFEGTIAFIDPVLDPRTRTVKVRVNVDNDDLLLKPEMFVRAVVKSKVASGERALSEDLRGKWISPMHPEIIKDGPGTCDVCGMPLVPIEELGYEPELEGMLPPMIVPSTAPLITGRRAVVYVRVPGSQRPRFEGREIVLGPRAGDSYIVESGLEVGELVVVHGAFKIDSAMQIEAKPSMMGKGGMPAGGGHDHGGDLDGMNDDHGGTP